MMALSPEKIIYSKLNEVNYDVRSNATRVTPCARYVCLSRILANNKLLEKYNYGVFCQHR
jgi:hypothetical protein